jgi:dihydroceramidase
MEVNLRPSLKSKYGTIRRNIQLPPLTQIERVAHAERDTAILKTLWMMVAVGLGIFLGGFGIWALDNQYCSTIRRWRHEVGLPWGILLEGHGWW